MATVHLVVTVFLICKCVVSAGYCICAESFRLKEQNRENTKTLTSAHFPQMNCTDRHPVGHAITVQTLLWNPENITPESRCEPV